jgi:hypothetical protein
LNGKPVGPLGLTGEVRLLELAPSGALLNKSPGNKDPLHPIEVAKPVSETPETRE